MKSILAACLTSLALVAFLAPVPADALTVGGSVKQPLNLKIEDLAKFGTVETRLTDLTAEKVYNGVFAYRGVPLRALLEAAAIRKEEGGFYKPTDMAIAVRNKEGKTSVLSWGEVFYRDSGNAVIAFSATPVVPHHSQGCAQCHGEEFYQPTLDKLKRKVGLPRLVLPNDFYSDRSIEDVVSIEVIDLKRGSAKGPDPKPSSEKFSITDPKGITTEYTELSGYRTIKVAMKEVGDGRGFHGLKKFEGVPVRDILSKANAGEEIDKAMLITSTDGYQVLYSFGEIFLSPLGERIVISQGKRGLAGEKKFSLIIPDDTAADRMVKTVNKVEIISLKPPQAPCH